MAKLHEEWTTAAWVLCVGALVVVGSGWHTVGESPQERSVRILAKFEKEDRAREAAMAAQAHPHARINDVAALRLCQQHLKAASRDPETAFVPDVGWVKGGANWRFLWNTHSRMVRMRNGLGQEVATEALCMVDEQTKQIILLTLDGKTLIGPAAPITRK